MMITKRRISVVALFRLRSQSLQFVSQLLILPFEQIGPIHITTVHLGCLLLLRMGVF